MKLKSFAIIFCLLLPIVLAYPIEKYNIEKGKGAKPLEDKIPDLPNKIENKGGIITSWFLKGLGRLTGGMSNKPKEKEIQNAVATSMFLKGVGRLAADMSDKPKDIEKCTWNLNSMPKKERLQYIEKILIGKLGSMDKLLQEVKQQEKLTEEASRQEKFNKQKNEKEDYSKINFIPFFG